MILYNKSMHYTVYLDVLFLENFCMDLWLLWLEGRLFKTKSCWYRLAGASALGAAFACMMVLFPAAGRRELLVVFSLAGSLLLPGVAYGFQKRRIFVQQWLLLIGLTFFTGGLGELLKGWFHNDHFFWLFPLSFLCGGVLLAAVEARREQKNLCQVRLVWRGSSICLTGLKDTGNTLYTPEGRQPVYVVSADSVRDWSRQGVEQILWIPFRSVGEKGSVLPAIQIDELWIDEVLCRTKPVIAFSRYPVSSDGRYQILLHSQEALP